MIRTRPAVYAALVFAAFLLLSSCEPVLTQDPAEHFSDGKLPASAYRFANQIWGLPASQKIAARLRKDQANAHLVRVGVMDNGVDVTHPDLVEQIDFGLQNGRVASAGWDVMGGDRFAVPQILRYEYYAFGAQNITDGLIVGPPKDPFALLAKYDRDFMNQFIPKLERHESLQKTLFSKINRENFSLVGAHYYALEDFDPKLFEKRRLSTNNSEKLVGPNWKPTHGSEDALREAIEKRYFMIHEPWLLSDKGLPAARGLRPGAQAYFEPKIVYANFAGADEFATLVKSEFESFAKRSGYARDFANLVEFMRPRFFDVSATAETRQKEALERLHGALVFKRRGYSGEDPFHALEKAIYAAALSRKLSTLTEWPERAVVPSAEDLKITSVEILGLAREAAEHVQKNAEAFLDDERDAAQEYLLRIRPWSNLYFDYLRRRGWSPSYGPVALSPAAASLYREHLVHTKHPLLDPESVSKSHGTHVAGIIAKQNENIRIVPLRVTTQTTRKSPIKDSEIASQFREEFLAWLRHPLVARAIEGRFGAAYPGLKGPQVLEEVIKIFAVRMPKDFEKNRLDYRFLGEVQHAVETAGNDRLKLVNISLGTAFDRAVVDYRNLDLNKQVESWFEFMKFEYFKWKIGKAASEKARGTLFLIATGNDGAWRDGRSRSSLPVDLSSPFLADFEDPAKGWIAPNNHIKNMIGVGSLSQIDEISSFSNLLISRAPMVMAHGEAVLSPIRAISSEATDAIWMKEVSIVRSLKVMTKLLQDKRFEDLLKKRFTVTGSAAEMKERLTQLRQRLNSDKTIYTAVEAGLKMDLFLRFPNTRARMSGTSMATPTLTGLLASEIHRRATQASISANQLYDHPDFTPEKLIKLVQGKAEPLFKDSSVIALKKWTGEVNWSKSSEEVAIDKLLNEARSASSPAAGDPVFPSTQNLKSLYRLFQPVK